METKIFISRKALERLKKDKFVRENRKWYNQQIFLISQDPFHRPSERIGHFIVAPRGHEIKRIAYHFEMNDKFILIYIDDFLYHKSDTRYVDNWNEKVNNKQISLRDYNDYVPFTTL